MSLIELANIDSAAEAFGQLLDAPPLKYIRNGTLFTYGGTRPKHEDIAQINGLPVILVDEKKYCHDGGRMQLGESKIIVFGNTGTLEYVTEDGMPVDYPDFRALGYEKFKTALVEWNTVVETAHRVTCGLLVAVANVLPTQPEIFWTISSYPEDAVIYQP